MRHYESRHSLWRLFSAAIEQKIDFICHTLYNVSKKAAFASLKIQEKEMAPVNIFTVLYEGSPCEETYTIEQNKNFVQSGVGGKPLIWVQMTI